MATSKEEEDESTLLLSVDASDEMCSFKQDEMDELLAEDESKPNTSSSNSTASSKETSKSPMIATTYREFKPPNRNRGYDRRMFFRPRMPPPFGPRFRPPFGCGFGNPDSLLGPVPPHLMGMPMTNVMAGLAPLAAAAAAMMSNNGSNRPFRPQSKGKNADATPKTASNSIQVRAKIPSTSTIVHAPRPLMDLSVGPPLPAPVAATSKRPINAARAPNPSFTGPKRQTTRIVQIQKGQGVKRTADSAANKASSSATAPKVVRTLTQSSNNKSVASPMRSNLREIKCHDDSTQVKTAQRSLPVHARLGVKASSASSSNSLGLPSNIRPAGPANSNLRMIPLTGSAPPMSSSQKLAKSAKVRISNLPPKANFVTVSQMTAAYGDVKSLNLEGNKATIEFEDATSATRFVEENNRKTMGQVVILVTKIV